MVAMSTSLKLFVVRTGEHIEIDAENGFCDECNLNDVIFNSGNRTTNLIIKTDADVNKSVTKTLVQRGNNTFINLGDSDYYLSNFIARNSRMRNVVIQQVLHFHDIGISRTEEGTTLQYGRKVLHCSTSNERYYAELYNVPPANQYYSLTDNELSSYRQFEVSYRLYPHGFDDLVFIIYQPENFKYEGRQSTITPLLQ